MFSVELTGLKRLSGRKRLGLVPNSGYTEISVD
jgi:hypothetical protein